MEINMFFNDLPIRILGTHEEPAFYAIDIAQVLAINNFHNIIRNFSPKEIVQHEDRERLGIVTYKKYRANMREEPNMILLTAFGAYRLIMCGNTQKSEEFRDWVFVVLEKLRLKGKYEIDQVLHRLRTINEEMLHREGKHLKYIKELEERQAAFENLTERLYLIEFKNDPTLMVQRHVRDDELDDYDDDFTKLTEDDKVINPWDDDNIRDYKMRFRADPEYKNRIHRMDVYLVAHPEGVPKYTYKITSTYTEKDKTQGTVRYYGFVKDVKETMKRLDKALYMDKLDSKDDVNYYSCDLHKILNAVSMVLKEA